MDTRIVSGSAVLGTGVGVLFIEVSAFQGS